LSARSWRWLLRHSLGPTPRRHKGALYRPSNSDPIPQKHDVVSSKVDKPFAKAGLGQPCLMMRHSSVGGTATITDSREAMARSKLLGNPMVLCMCSPHKWITRHLVPLLFDDLSKNRELASRTPKFLIRSGGEAGITILWVDGTGETESFFIRIV
jgi:hypothetical protein